MDVVFCCRCRECPLLVQRWPLLPSTVDGGSNDGPKHFACLLSFVFAQIIVMIVDEDFVLHSC